MDSLTPGQQSVLHAFFTYGIPLDDTTLTTYVHHKEPLNQSSSGIRSRRAELARKGLIQAVDTRVLKSGRHAVVHALTPSGKVLASQLVVPAV